MDTTQPTIALLIHILPYDQRYLILKWRGNYKTIDRIEYQICRNANSLRG